MMIDKKLEYQIKTLHELSDLWMKYQPFLSPRVTEQQYTAQDEESFLKLKCDVALRHDVLLDVVGEDKNIRSTAQSILQIVIRSISLRKLQQKTEAELQKMEIEWHDAYLLINDTIAQLEAKREELAGVTESDMRRERRKETWILVMATVRGSAWTKFVIFVIVLVIAHVLVTYGPESIRFDWWSRIKDSFSGIFGK
jgi:hypothetical protein